jgi:PLD-like domain
MSAARALLLCAALLAVWLGTAVYQARKPLPPGMHLASALCTVPEEQVQFIADVTAADAWGHVVSSQAIFAALLARVQAAQQFIVLDFRSFGAGPPGAARPLAVQLTEALLARRRERPQLAVLFILDPSSEDYGARRSAQLQLLRAAGVQVVSTDLNALRDSNPLYSSVWRLALRWWDTPSSPFGVATRRLNYKANGRRLLLADDGHGQLTALIGSASPADAESAWSNVALSVSGGPLPQLLASELAVARFSGWQGASAPFALPHAAACLPASGPPAAGSAQLQLLTEGAIATTLLQQLAAAGPGTAIDVAMEQLAERRVLEALLAAAHRGATVRLLLDPDDSGSNGGLNGFPNQPAASELVTRSDGAIHVRWYRTHGERFHCALLLIYDARTLWLTAGSAQMTRRSLNDYNLQANAALTVARGAPLASQALGYFDTLWDNRAGLGIEYSADFTAFANPAQSDYWLYRLMEASGFAPF